MVCSSINGIVYPLPGYQMVVNVHCTHQWFQSFQSSQTGTCHRLYRPLLGLLLGLFVHGKTYPKDMLGEKEQAIDPTEVYMIISLHRMVLITTDCCRHGGGEDKKTLGHRSPRLEA